MGVLDILKNGYPGKGISPEEAQGAALGAGFDELRQKDAELEEVQLKSKEELAQFKKKMLSDIFSKMRELGVDPGNLREVSAFTQQLEQTDPDLVKLFETAMDALNPDNEEPMVPGAPQGDSPMESPDLMGAQTQNLQQRILR